MLKVVKTRVTAVRLTVLHRVAKKYKFNFHYSLSTVNTCMERAPLSQQLLEVRSVSRTLHKARVSMPWRPSSELPMNGESREWSSPSVVWPFAGGPGTESLE